MIDFFKWLWAWLHLNCHCLWNIKKFGRHRMEVHKYYSFSCPLARQDSCTCGRVFYKTEDFDFFHEKWVSMMEER